MGCFWKQFFLFVKHKRMLQVKQMANVLFSLPSIAQYVHPLRMVW